MKKIFVLIIVLLAIAVCAAEETSPEDRLILLGYDSENQEVSVANFQKANGLSPTGIIDPATRDALYSPKAVSKEDYIAYCLAKGEYTRVYERGSSGGGVRQLQTQLSALGYLQGASGEYDIDTFYAVSLFQAVNGIYMNGVADGVTQAAVFSAVAIPCAGFENMFDVSRGSTGTVVKQLQNALFELGFFEGEATGLFGLSTEGALLAFQRANSLEENGRWSLHQQLLYNYGMCVNKSETDEYAAALSLSVGDTGEYVRELETLLKALGYFEGEPNKAFDYGTQYAVTVFQEANGLIPTGVADPATRALAGETDCIPYADYEAVARVSDVMPGMSNLAVELCSKRLVELGFPISETREYDDELDQALTVFRQAIGISAETGADRAVLEAMNADSAPRYEAALEMSEEFIRQKALDNALETLLKLALESVGKPYEAGKTGPDSFGSGGLAYYCCAGAGITVPPTVSLQLENAMTLDSWSTEIENISAGRQLFFADGESVYTALAAGDKLVIVSAAEGIVTQIDVSAGLEKYEFIGSVSYIEGR